MEKLLVARDIVKFYGGVKVLDGVSLAIEDRDSIGLFGPNACGKTTFLKILAGIIEPDRGEVVRNGSIAMVFQDDKMVPWMDLVGNVAILLRLKGVSKSKATKIALEKLRMLDIERFSNMKPSQLSGGTLRKAAIARALTLEPKILLLDEPFTGIDEASRRSIKSLVRSLVTDQGISIIVTSHYIDDFRGLVDEVLFMSRAPTRVIRVEHISNIVEDQIKNT